MSDEEAKDVEEIETEEPSPEDVLGAEAFEDEPTPKEEPVTDAGETKDVEKADEPVETSSDSTEDVKEKDAEAPVTTTDDEPVTLVPYKVSYGGQEFELQVTAEQAATLDAQNKTALQFPHLQEKYTDLKTNSDRAAQLAASTAPGAPTEGQPAAFDPEEFSKRMKPAVDSAVERGAISKEFSEMYPTEAANYAWGAIQLDAIQQALTPVVKQYAEGALNQQRDQVQREIYDGMAGLAAESPDVFNDLNDPTAKDGFFKHLIEMNVDVDFLRRDMKGALTKLWGSYQGPRLMEAARMAAQKAQQEQAEKRVVSGGGGGGGGGREAPKTDPLSDINAILGGGR
jgi:hypothetical protein